MSTASIRTSSQWMAGEIDSTLNIEADGTLSNLPDNIFPNPTLSDFVADGELSGLTRPEVIVQDGVSVYVSRVGSVNAPRQPSTLTKQNSGGSIPLSEMPWTASQPIVDGDTPVRNESSTTPQAAALPRHEAPIVETVSNASTKKGLKAGWYPYAQAYRDKHHRRTTRTAVTWVYAANGQSLKCPNGASPPEGARYVEHLLGKPQDAPDKGANTLRVRRVVRLTETRLGKVEITGPLKGGKTPTNRNETKVGRPAAPTGKNVKKAPGAHDLQVMEEIRFYIQIYDGYGWSELSNPTNPKTVTKVDEGRAFKIRPKNLPRGMRWRPWVEIGTTHYRVYPKIGAGVDSFSRSGLHPKNRVPIYGYDPENEPPGLRHGLVQEEPPEEDETGIESPDPSTEPDTPTAFGAALPAAGHYLVATAPMIGDDEGLIGAAAKITLNGTQMFRVKLQSTVSKLPNAQLQERDSDGTVRDWTIDSSMAGGEYSLDDPESGIIRLYTSVPITGAVGINDSPTAKPANLIPVNTQDTWFGIATASVSNYIDGTAVVRVYEFDASGTALLSNDIVSVSGDGITSGELSIGPEGDVAWNAETTAIRLFLGMVGPTRDLSARFSHFDLYDTKEPPRKVIASPGGATDDFDISPVTPSPTTSYFAVGTPKSPPGYIAGELPIKIAHFENGALQGGVKTVLPGGAEVTVTPEAAIDGEQGLLVRDDGQNVGAGAYVEYSISEWSTSFAARELRKIVRKPSRSRQNILRVAQPNNTRIGIMDHSTTGAVNLLAYDKNGNPAGSRRISNVVEDGDLVDWELNGANFGTQNGILIASFAKNGGKREVAAEIGGIDWRNTTPRKSQHGIFVELNAQSTSEYHIDQIVFTHTGDIPGRESGVSPVGINVPPVDRPPVVDASEVIVPGEYRDTTSYGEQINQGYAFIQRGTPRQDYPYLGYTGITGNSPPLIVKPGQAYNYAVQAREVIFEDGVAYPFDVTLHDGRGNEQYVGSPYPNGLTKVTAQEQWTGVDRVLSFVPDPGMIFMRVTHRNMGPGIYVWQEELVPQGDYTTQVSRDSKRTEDSSVGGNFSIVLDSQLKGKDLVPAYGGWWTEFAAVGDITNLSYRSSDESPAEVANPTWSVATGDPAQVPEARVLEVSGYLDGSIPPGGIYLKKGYGIGTLQRDDGSELPGGVWLGHPDPGRFVPEQESGKVAGHVFNVPISERVGWLTDFTMAVYLESAMTELEELGCFNRELDEISEWQVAAPHAKGEGRLYTIRFAEPPVFEVIDIPSQYRIFSDGSRDRVIYAKCEVAEAEILEESNL